MTGGGANSGVLTEVDRTRKRAMADSEDEWTHGEMSGRVRTRTAEEHMRIAK
jgi:hypothetical protein